MLSLFSLKMSAWVVACRFADLVKRVQVVLEAPWGPTTKEIPAGFTQASKKWNLAWKRLKERTLKHFPCIHVQQTEPRSDSECKNDRRDVIFLPDLFFSVASCSGERRKHSSNSTTFAGLTLEKSPRPQSVCYPLSPGLAVPVFCCYDWILSECFSGENI